MKPIDDFELLWRPEESRFRRAGDRSSEAVITSPPPPYPRLAYLFWSYWEVDYRSQCLLYRGAYLKNIGITGSELVAQFEAERGYVLITDSPRSPSVYGAIDIYYLLRDFSGADWATVTGRPPFFQTRLYLDACFHWVPFWPSLECVSNEEPVPSLTGIEVEDDRHLRFCLRRTGWFRLSLYEDPPQRFLNSTPEVEHRNSNFLEPRYFRVDCAYDVDQASEPKCWKETSARSPTIP